MLSNLLQELALARDHNRKRIVLDESRLTENPVDRLSRMIKILSGTLSHVVSMVMVSKLSPQIPKIALVVSTLVFTFLTASLPWQSTIESRKGETAYELGCSGSCQRSLMTRCS
jgi:hypothetical protein